MKKYFVVSFLVVSAVLVACKKEKPTVQNETPKTSLDGEWDVLEWGNTIVSTQGDTTYEVNHWDSVAPPQVVNTVASSYETINEIVSVDGVSYRLDEWEFDPNDLDSLYDNWIWLERVNPVNGSNHYFVLGKKD
jgi:hypothetical protein